MTEVCTVPHSTARLFLEFGLMRFRIFWHQALNLIFFLWPHVPFIYTFWERWSSLIFLYLAPEGEADTIQTYWDVCSRFTAQTQRWGPAEAHGTEAWPNGATSGTQAGLCCADCRVRNFFFYTISILLLVSCVLAQAHFLVYTCCSEKEKAGVIKM